MKILRERSAQLMKSTIGMAALSELLSISWQKPTIKVIESLGVGFGTNTGSRSRNEDRFTVARIVTSTGRKFTVAIVCDGVGGSEMGDAAAALAIATFLEKLSSTDKDIETNQLLVDLIKYTDKKVREEFNGRGATTLSVILVSQDGQMAASNIGDSRIYAWSPRKHLVQISIDDTIENELKNFLVPDGAELPFHHMRNGLSQAIGEIGRDENDLRIVPLDPNSLRDGAIIATDGAWKSDELAFNLVAINAASSQDVVRRIISLSAWTGAVDNVSLIAIESFRKIFDDDDFPVSPGPYKSTLMAWIGENKIIATDASPRTRLSRRSDHAEESYVDQNTALKVAGRRSPSKRKNRNSDVPKSEKEKNKQLSFVEKTENNDRLIRERATIEVSTDEGSSRDK